MIDYDKTIFGFEEAGGVITPRQYGDPGTVQRVRLVALQYMLGNISTDSFRSRVKIILQLDSDAFTDAEFDRVWNSMIRLPVGFTIDHIKRVIEVLAEKENVKFFWCYDRIRLKYFIDLLGLDLCLRIILPRMSYVTYPDEPLFKNILIKSLSENKELFSSDGKVDIRMNQRNKLIGFHDCLVDILNGLKNGSKDGSEDLSSIKSLRVNSLLIWSAPNVSLGVQKVAGLPDKKFAP